MNLFEFAEAASTPSTAPDKKKEAAATQLAWLIRALRAGRKVTPMDALNECGCFRLGARIYDLRKDGWEIETDLSEGYATYFLKAAA